jgi:hypothetical protein
MIKRIVNKIKIFSLIYKIFKTEPNDYVFGSKVRNIMNSYEEGKKIREEEIFKK